MELSQEDPPHTTTAAMFSAADVTALSHLYRGELYRSTVWRTRLDATTNWAVATTGLALSLSFASTEASPLPLVLTGLLVSVFLYIEARRYRFFDFWRIRAHIFEIHFFGPMLRGQGVRTDNGWNEVLYEDYTTPRLHITLVEALGRRLRHNYSWIFGIQLVAYFGKLIIHPTPLSRVAELLQRAAIGPIPGELVMFAGLLFHGGWMTIAFLTYRSRRGADRVRPPTPPKDRLLDLARGR